MIRPSHKANRTNNPIRNIVDNLKPPVDHPKLFLNLALGDPTLFGNLKCPDVVQKALQECLISNKFDGYCPSFGSVAARNAVAIRVSDAANAAIARYQNAQETVKPVGLLMFRERSWESNLTDSFSSENKKCDDNSHLNDYFMDMRGGTDSAPEEKTTFEKASPELNSDLLPMNETVFLHTDSIEASNLNRFAKTIKGQKNKVSEHRNINSMPSSVQLTCEDVIITSGCSSAIELAISVLLNEGDNLLVPRPGFPLYQVIAESLGGHVKQYPLKPDSDWECDTQAMEVLIDSSTKAILITNPSNPCGSNYSAEHLLSIIAVARKFSLPIIADEIYGGCIFAENNHFIHLCSLCDDVPILSLGGLAKEFVVPGWRVGWLTIHDAYVNMSASMRYPSSNHTGSRPMESRSNIGQYLDAQDNSNNCFFESNNSQTIYNNATAEQSNDTANEFNSNGCKFNYLGKRGTNNYNIINGKNSYSNYRNTDTNIHNENFAKNGQDFASVTWPRTKNPCTLNGLGMSSGNESDNKINLQEYHMNGTVDIDELLINYINQNEGVAYSPDRMSNRVSPADCSNITEDRSDVDKSKISQVGTNNRQSVPNPKVGRFTDVRKGLRSLTQLTLGASSLLQSVLPRVLTPIPGSDDSASLQQFHENYMETLRKNTEFCLVSLQNIPELSMNAPKGAMYIMLKIRMNLLFDIGDDKEFAEKLLLEENVSVLPGACFNMGGYIRLVTCAPSAIFQDGLERLKLFCSRHNIAGQ